MKINKILLGVSLSAMVLAATPALATDGGTANTNGTIDFEMSKDTVGEIIKPETDPNEVIETEEGSHSEGPLRLQFVPDFNFGSRELKTGAQSFNPTYMKYTYKEVDGLEESKKGDKYMPQFIQVTDERGTNEGFILTVKSTIFQRKIKTADSLPNASITLKHGQFSNSVHQGTDFDGVMSKFEGENSLTIPTGEAAAAEVMRTVSDKTTNGTQTSLVLDKTYDAAKLDSLATDENKDVVFTKTNKDIPTIINYTEGQIKDPYVATITWTLTNGE